MKRIAIVHDWLTSYAGAERVLEQLLLLFPDSDLFSVCDFLADEDRVFLGAKTPETTFIQHLPAARKHYRNYLPLMPLAVEQLDLSGYDIIISSSHAVAKGVITGPDQLHISYVHSPMRYAWDLHHQYLADSGLDRGVKGFAAKWFLHKLRIWDLRTANGVDHFVANSSFIAKRIFKVYRRHADVIYPPVDVQSFSLEKDKGDYFLTASRLVPYKKVDLIVNAFKRMPEKRLVVIGDGPERKKVEAAAAGCGNIAVLGYQKRSVLVEYMKHARAFVFASEEDFGITPVEAQACGTPVIAFGKGGVLETVRGIGSQHPTGCFFQHQSVDDIVNAVDCFEREEGNFSPDACRENAERFSSKRFRAAFMEYVAEVSRHSFPEDGGNPAVELTP